MNIFLFITIAVTALTIFVCIYSYSLQFFSETKKGREWRKRIQQDAYVGLAIIFLTMGFHAITAYDAMVGTDKFVIIVWIVIIMVLSLHIGVGIIDTVNNRKSKRNLEKEFDGVSYTYIGTVNDFHNQAGQSFDIKGTSIAVFKIDDQIHISFFEARPNW